MTQYRNYTISYNPPPIPIRTMDWEFSHKDYDGPEDNRCGHAGSLDEAMAEIDYLEDDGAVYMCLAKISMGLIHDDVNSIELGYFTNIALTSHCDQLSIQRMEIKL